MHSSPTEIQLLTEALDKHGDVMCDIAERGILGGELVFIFPRHSKAAKEYDAWLEDIFSKYLRHSDEKLAEIIAFLLEHGQNIRQRLNNNQKFYKRFRKELWPAFMRVVDNNGAFEQLANDPHIWDLLALNKGEQLLEKWGLAPVGLLYGENAYPVDLQAIIIEVLLEGDDNTVDALYKYKDELLFQKLMRRQLSVGSQAALASKLATLCPNYPEKACPSLPQYLHYYVSIKDNAALAEELGPAPSGPVTWIPFYGSYYTAKKLWQGRGLTGGDAVAVGLDAFAIVPIGFIAGKVAVISKPAGKFLNKFAEPTTKTVSQKLVKTKTRQIKQGQKIKLPQASNSVSALLQKNQQLLKQFKEKAQKLVVFDVTKPIRFLYQKIGGKTMRFFGFEARVFMRKDAKVLMNPSQGLSGHFFRETAERALNDVVGESAGKALTALKTSETMSKIIISKQTIRLLNKAKKKVTAWQQNISAWWLMSMKPVTSW